MSDHSRHARRLTEQHKTAGDALCQNKKGTRGPLRENFWATGRQMPHLPTYVAPYWLPLVPDTTRVTPDRLLGGNFPLNHHPHNT